MSALADDAVLEAARGGGAPHETVPPNATPAHAAAPNDAARDGAAPPRPEGGPALSVVVATYNRPAAVSRLLRELAAQTLPPSRFEVVVVDDGSAVPTADALGTPDVPFALDVARQANAGPAAARDTAIRRARAPVVVVVDDDMRIAPDFLAAHLAEHPDGSRRLVLGRLRAHPDAPLPAFERFQLAQLDRLAEAVHSGAARVRGGDVYTGNVSFRRSDYLTVGGFDRSLRLSEDAELGMRMERAGVELCLSEAAGSAHASEHASAAGWMRRARAYGTADVRVAAKQLAPVAGLAAADPERAAIVAATDPWRFLFAVSPFSRPVLLTSALVPGVARPLAGAAMLAARAAGALRAERVAMAGVTFVYGVLYYAGVRDGAGGGARALAGLGRYLNAVPARAVGPLARLAKCVADVRADHRALLAADAKYRPSTGPRAPHEAAPNAAVPNATAPNPVPSDAAPNAVPGAPAGGRGDAGPAIGRTLLRMTADAVRRVGFQMLVAYRVMRLLRDLRLTPLAMVVSRGIRHLYGADLHWNAELAPGVLVVHGVGLVVSPAARVAAGGVLFQHVTLGESVHPTRRDVGGPTLEPGVHVGPGATLLGPITIGRDTKIMAGAVVMDDVPPGSVVEIAAPMVRPRRAPRESSA